MFNNDAGSLQDIMYFVKWSKPFFLYVGEDSFNGALIVWYIFNDTIQRSFSKKSHCKQYGE